MIFSLIGLIGTVQLRAQFLFAPEGQKVTNLPVLPLFLSQPTASIPSTKGHLVTDAFFPGSRNHKAMNQNQLPWIAPAFSTPRLVKPTPPIRESIIFWIDSVLPDDSLSVKAIEHDHKQLNAHVITHCRSWLEIRNHLAHHPPGNGLPWGSIHFLVGGNAGTNPILPLFPQEQPASFRQILKAIEHRQFPALSPGQIDEQSSLYLHNCNQDSATLMARALGLLLFQLETDLPIRRSASVSATKL
ncbi:MAG: hypothetical protein AAGD05_12275 [Bacteroidota bacterium]